MTPAEEQRKIEADVSFVYKPLPENHIRIISILPNSDEGPLSLLLKDVLLSEPRPYAALSYAWGKSNLEVTISVNGISFQITRNLYEAILRLRTLTPDRKRTWADAICINQIDIDERSRQVQKMCAIYASALLVIVWVGEEDEETDLMLEGLARLQEYYEQDHVPGNVSDNTLLESAQALAVKNFFSRPWFSRLWTLQEAVLPRYAHLICGSRQLEWNTSVKACVWLMKYGR